MLISAFRFGSRVALAAILCALLTLNTVDRVAADSYIHGVDVYTGDGVVNWSTAKISGGIQFAFVKATEGVNFVDSKFNSNMSGANAAGIYVGPYHVCRVESKDGVKFTSYDGNPFPVGSNPWLDATSEASDFVAAIRPYYTSGSYLPPVADVETSIIQQLPFSTSLQKAFVSNWLQVFSDTVQNALNVTPMIYTSESSANTYYSNAIASSHRLWEAWWKGTGTTQPPTQANTPAWPLWTFWQYSDTEVIPGVPGSNGTNGNESDADVFNGSISQLTGLLVHDVPGDYNHNGVVDMADYVVWRDSAGSTVLLAADGNNDGVVNASDYTYWRQRFGQTAGSGAGSGELSQGTVPEPTAAALLVLLITLGFPARSR